MTRGAKDRCTCSLLWGTTRGTFWAEVLLLEASESSQPAPNTAEATRAVNNTHNRKVMMFNFNALHAPLRSISVSQSPYPARISFYTSLKKEAALATYFCNIWRRYAAANYSFAGGGDNSSSRAACSVARALSSAPLTPGSRGRPKSGSFPVHGSNAEPGQGKIGCSGLWP